MKLALVCIAKEEDQYIEEWVQWHKHLGFDDVFVFQNNWRCTKQIDAHLIELDGSVKQLEAYNSWTKTHYLEYDWAAFIDVDEFIVPRSKDDLKTWLDKRQIIPEVALNWRLMGDSGLSGKKQTTMSVLQRFTHGSKTLNKHVKQLVNIAWHLKAGFLPVFINPHCTAGVSCAAYDMKQFVGPFQTDNLDKVHDFELWHYATKTREELHEKVKRGRADTTQTREAEEDSYFEQHNVNEIELLDAKSLQDKHIYEQGQFQTIKNGPSVIPAGHL